MSLSIDLGFNISRSKMEEFQLAERKQGKWESLPVAWAERRDGKKVVWGHLQPQVFSGLRVMLVASNPPAGHWDTALLDF